MYRLNVLLALILLVSCNSKQKKGEAEFSEEEPPKLETPTHLMIGDKISLSDYTLNSNNGKVIESDKVILIDFWATWCGPCIASFPQLEEVQKKYKDKLQIIAVSDESNKKIRSFLEKKPFDLAFFNNKDKALFKIFEVKNLPMTCLISPEGEFLWVGRSENLEPILEQYFEIGAIKIREEDSKYYNTYFEVSLEKESIIREERKAKSNNMIAIFDAEDYDAFRMTSAFRAHDKPANIEFKSIQISDAVATLMEIESSRLLNPRKDLDSMIIDVIAKSENGKFTNRFAIDKVLEDLQLIYDFKIIEKYETVEVLKLIVTDSNKLNFYLETTEGGGMARPKDGKEEFFRLNLAFVASILEKRIKTNYVIYDGDDKRKFTFKLNQFGSVEDLKKELKNIGLSLENSKTKLRFVEIE